MVKIELKHVHFMPPDLEPGILYVSQEFQVAAHLCPCNCGSKIVTPLGPTEWKFTEKRGKATLYPSIGNWQLPCRSHYWIENGEIYWSYQWSTKQIETGRQAEEQRKVRHYEKRARRRTSIFHKIINVFKK